MVNKNRVREFSNSVLHLFSLLCDIGLNRVASVLSNAFAVFIEVRSEFFVFRVAESDAREDIDRAVEGISAHVLVQLFG